MTVPAPVAPAPPVKPSKIKAAANAVIAFLLSPQARRYEVALALGLYEAVRASLGHA